MITSQQKYKEVTEQEQVQDIMLKLKRLEYRLSVLYAPIGQGKTTALAAICYWFKRLLKKRVVTVATEVGFRKETFGKVLELNLIEFAEQLEMIDWLANQKYLTSIINSLTDPEDIKAFVKPIFDKMGMVLYDTIVIADEWRKLISSRSSMSNVNKLGNTFSMEMRHNFVTFVGTIPDWKEIDRNTLQQLYWRGDTSFNELAQTVTLQFRGKYPWEWELDARDYRKFFNSYNIVGFGNINFDKFKKN